MKFNKHALFAALMVCLAIAFLEATFNLLARVSPKVDALLSPPWIVVSSIVPPMVPDDRLIYRGNPDYPGHDTNGFRNPRVPAQADIVAVGDSQTYGVGVEPQDAWPRQLESMAGTTAYTIAHGGYGPVHYLVLWNEALALHPKIIIEAFYAGNDLFDSFNLVYNRGQFSELKDRDPAVRMSVQAEEERDPIAQRVPRIFAMGETAEASNVEAVTADTGHFWPRDILAKHSKLYGLLRRAQYELGRDAAEWEDAKGFAEAHSAYCEIFDDGRHKTVFTPEYRLSALDFKDSRIAEGQRISLKAIQQMNHLAATHDIRFVVVLIPTKEFVFRELVQNPSPAYRALIENEDRLWSVTTDFLKGNGIEYVDALGGLREELVSRDQPYRVSYDGHPNKFGQRAIASVIARYLQTR